MRKFPEGQSCNTSHIIFARNGYIIGFYLKKNVFKILSEYILGGIILRIDTYRTKIYTELSDSQNKKFFYVKQMSFLHKIDSLYYNIYIHEDSNDNTSLDSLFNTLAELKKQYREERQEIEYQGLQVKLGSYAMVYNYRLCEPDKYDIFIADYLPNTSTPRIVVQIRSLGLWVDGVMEVIEESFSKVRLLLEQFSLKISKTMENRLDYAYHTNAIQSPYKFFGDSNLNKQLRTNLTIYQKIGQVREKGLTLDYLALGQRKSNNVFFRCYNKTREVIEQGYKAFFIEYWYQNKMISQFDKYCFEYAYQKKSYDAIHEARLLFYLTHGSDLKIKKYIREILDNQNVTYAELEEYADRIVPKTTIIMNIEYQTKRKFYYYSDNVIDTLKCPQCTNELRRLYKIIYNRAFFIEYLTRDTVAFVRDRLEKKDYKFLAWWKRLRSLKLDNCYKVDKEYLRNYSNQVDINKAAKRALNSLGTFSTYLHKNGNTDFIEDVSDLVGYVNDNDIRHNNFKIINGYGEIIGRFDNRQSKEYIKYKSNKYKQIKNKLQNKSLAKNLDEDLQDSKEK